MSGGTPFDLSTQKTAAATQLSRSLSYLCYALQVDNYTNQWFYCGEANQYIAPRIVGKIISMPGTASFSLKNQAPAGYSQAPLIPGQLCVATPFSEFVPPSPGVYQQPTGQGSANQPAELNPLVLTNADSPSGQPKIFVADTSAFETGCFVILFLANGTFGGVNYIISVQPGVSLTLPNNLSGDIPVGSTVIRLQSTAVMGGFSTAPVTIANNGNFPVRLTDANGTGVVVDANGSLPVAIESATLPLPVIPQGWNNTAFNAPAAGTNPAIQLTAPGVGTRYQIDRISVTLGQTGATAMNGAIAIRQTSSSGTIEWEEAIGVIAGAGNVFQLDRPDLRLRLPSLNDPIWIGVTGISATVAGAISVGYYITT